MLLTFGVTEFKESNVFLIWKMRNHIFIYLCKWNHFSFQIMQQVSLYVAIPVFFITLPFSKGKSIIFKISSLCQFCERKLTVHEAEHANFDNAPNTVWYLMQ